jgi:ribonucleotide reductase alpha subunit
MPYDREEVYQATLEYFKGDALAANTFFKYCLKDKEGRFHELTPDDMHRRLAKEFARIEKKYENPMNEEYIYSFLRDFQYIVPQGSPMMGIGNDFVNLSLSNCVVVASPQDSISSIMDAGKDLANLFKRRCGVGLDISDLRPDGQAVSNAAGTTSGAWSFADFYSFVCRMIGQNGRRGALMIAMDVRHPDILKFINMKRDLTKVTGANISVKLTDDFMQAVVEDKDYLQFWPLTPNQSGKISRSVNAREVWEEIVKAATETAEPGLLFWDNATKSLPAHEYEDFKTVCVNPCQPADATLLTPNGIRTMGELRVGDAIWSGKQWTKVINKWSTGVKDVYEYHTNAGVFVGTKNHRVVSNGSKVEAQHAESIDVASCHAERCDERHFTYQSDNESINVADGLVLGDGGIHKASNNLVGLYVGRDDQDYFDSVEVKDLIGRHRPGIKDTFYEIKTTITSSELVSMFDRVIPDRYFRADPDTQMMFLRGLYSANGSICGNRVTLKSSSKKLILQVQQMLSGLGIRSYYTTNKSKPVDFSNGTYICKESYDLNISTDRDVFAHSIGFIQRYKTDKLDTILNKKKGRGKNNYEIKEVVYRSTEEVFDITVEAEEHTYWTGGLLVSNCAELMLSAYDSCRLISINLKHLVSDPFTKNAQFDAAKFQEVVAVAQRLSDDLVDLELEKIDRMIEAVDEEDEKILWGKLYNACLNGRRTGLGTHGLADALACLNLRYDSNDGLEMIDFIYRTLKEVSYMTSVDLAKERGQFGVFNWELEKENIFIKSLPAEIVEEMMKYGRRNISILTNAPTGSVSILSQTSSGIEPVFRNSYTRRKKLNHDDQQSPDDYVDTVGDRWREYEVYHHNVKDYLKLHPETKELPDYFVTSEEINWERRIELQSVIQSSIDHSISSTVNLPRGTNPEVVSSLYMLAWEKGLKGVTVYVDGSRDGVLISEPTTKKEEFQYINAPKRGENLDCDIHNVFIKGEGWIILVGLKDEKPYEVFGGLSENIEIPSNYKKGTLTKVNEKKRKPSRYDLKVNGLKIKDIIKIFNNPTYQVHTRMVSLALRHGTKPSFLVEQLQKDPDNDLTSFSKVLARVLKKYVADGTKVSGSSACQDCGGELVYQEGCVICASCGWSKCG